MPKERLIALEADVWYREPPPSGEPDFAYRSGSIPVLISAPHSAVHTRHGGAKEEEEYTAGLARLAAEETGAHVLYLRRRSLVDPNWDRGVPYKQHLALIARLAGIRFVLDIHGAAARRDFGIAMGTMAGRSCRPYRDVIIAALESCGFRAAGRDLDRLDLDAEFTANGQQGQETVTRYAWEHLGTPAVQFELNERLRVASRRPDASLARPLSVGPDNLAKTACALVDVVRSVCAATDV